DDVELVSHPTISVASELKEEVTKDKLLFVFWDTVCFNGTLLVNSQQQQTQILNGYSPLNARTTPTFVGAKFLLICVTFYFRLPYKTLNDYLTMKQLTVEEAIAELAATFLSSPLPKHTTENQSKVSVSVSLIKQLYDYADDDVRETIEQELPALFPRPTFRIGDRIKQFFKETDV